MKHRKSKILMLTSALALMSPALVFPDVIYREINPDDTVVRVRSDDWHPANFDVGTMIPAPYMKFANITLDGKDGEDDWTKADEVVVPLQYGSVQAVSLKAIYTDENVFIRARWKDETENREHHPWVWDADLERYIEGAQIEDSLFLSFEAGCEWTPSLLSGYVYDFDAWQWLAARSDPLAQAVDITGTVQSQPYPSLSFVEYPSHATEKSWIMKFDSYPEDKMIYASWDQLDRMYMFQSFLETVYVRSVPDGKPHNPPEFARQMPPPKFPPEDETIAYPQYSPLKLHGQAGDVSAKGQWDNGYWTVEFRRARNTPTKIMNDVIFNRLTQFSVHIFNQAERFDEASESGQLLLQFIPPEGMLVQD